jgi:hypothetical protein
MMSEEPEETNRESEKADLRRMLFFADVAFFALFLLSLFPSIFSVMFAAGGASLRVYIQVYSLMLFPWVLLFGIIAPWLLYALKKFRIAKAILIVPVLNALLILLYILLPSWIA